MENIPRTFRYRHRRLIVTLSSILACLFIPGENSTDFSLLKPIFPQNISIEVERYDTTLGGINVAFTNPKWEELLSNIDLDLIWEFIDSQYSCPGSKPHLVLYDNLSKRSLKFLLHSGLFKYSDVVEEGNVLRIELLETNESENPSGVIVINMGQVYPLLSAKENPRRLFYTSIISLLVHEMIHSCQLTREAIEIMIKRQNSEEYAYGLSYAVEELMRGLDITEDKKLRSFYTRENKSIVEKNPRINQITQKDSKRIRESFEASSIADRYGFNINIQIPSKRIYLNLGTVIKEIVEELES